MFVTDDPIDPEVQEIAQRMFDAARAGDADTLAAFLDAGGPVNLTNGTGDTLLIRSTGRTDFQNGDPAAQYRSIHDKLLRLPDATRLEFATIGTLVGVIVLLGVYPNLLLDVIANSVAPIVTRLGLS